MLEFKQDANSAILILTLTELVTLNSPYYLFVFTHVLTREVTAFIKSEIEDESNYPRRYNKFTINPSILFDGKQPGEWHYVVCEQLSDSNTDPSMSGEILEQGKLMLGRAVDFSFEKYDSQTSFKTYNG